MQRAGSICTFDFNFNFNSQKSFSVQLHAPAVNKDEERGIGIVEDPSWDLLKLLWSC